MKASIAFSQQARVFTDILTRNRQNNIKIRRKRKRIWTECAEGAIICRSESPASQHLGELEKTTSPS
jgi:hypothetical protein